MFTKAPQKMFALVIFSCILKLSLQNGYFRTDDLPLQDWNSLILKSVPNVGSKIVCGAMCEALTKEGNLCNSFKVKNSICELGNIIYLKEFEENDPTREAFYVVDKGPNYYINECDKGITSCGNHTKCNNELNGFSCECLTGFKDFVDGNGCSDIDECSELGNVCVANAGCINSIGGYTCQCNAGYQGFLQRKFREIATLN